jgi:hypothetical protein
MSSSSQYNKNISIIFFFSFSVCMPVIQIKTGAANYLRYSKQFHSIYAACDGVPVEV